MGMIRNVRKGFLIVVLIALGSLLTVASAPSAPDSLFIGSSTVMAGRPPVPISTLLSQFGITKITYPTSKPSISKAQAIFIARKTFIPVGARHHTTFTSIQAYLVDLTDRFPIYHATHPMLVWIVSFEGPHTLLFTSSIVAKRKPPTHHPLIDRELNVVINAKTGKSIMGFSFR